MVNACPPLSGTTTVPGDKSIGHRALMVSAIANGRSTILGLSEGQDTRLQLEYWVSWVCRSTATVIGQWSKESVFMAFKSRMVHSTAVTPEQLRA